MRTNQQPSPILQELVALGVMFMSNDGLSLERGDGTTLITFCAPVTADPPTGAAFDSGGGEVELACATADATIYYTVDGTPPTADSTAYDGTPIAVDANTTIRAIAAQFGLGSQPEGSFSYTVQAVTPVIDPDGDTGAAPISVTLASTTAGAAIYYTIDGTTPTADSTLYAGAFDIVATGTLKAIAIAAGFADSDIASADFTITP